MQDMLVLRHWCAPARNGGEVALGRRSMRPMIPQWPRRRQETRRLAQTDGEALIRDHAGRGLCGEAQSCHPKARGPPTRPETY